MCTLLLVNANNKGTDQPAHPRSQLALESMIAEPAMYKQKNKIPPSDMHVRIQKTPTGAGGLLLEGSSYQFFLLGNK